jgi:hypothetical protein
VAHRTLSGAQAKAPHELVALGFFQSHSTIIHWTDWCASDISGVHRTYLVCTGATVNCAQRSTVVNSEQWTA